ncbi:hypothetical protein JXQ31_07910 [candidate division KSB1 bacterium]|nr:hypothetical protein [candidate division KSB1 bacterium]
MKLHIILIFSVISLFSVKSVLSQQLVSVHATQLEPRKEAGYKFVIETSVPVTENTSFDIIFPQVFLLNNLILCSSTTMDGGLIVNVKNDTVRVSRFGPGTTLSAGQIDISVSSVINAADMQPDYDFEILQYDDDRQVSQIKSLHKVEQIQ